jgi:hypothetical protein
MVRTHFLDLATRQVLVPLNVFYSLIFVLGSTQQLQHKKIQLILHTPVYKLSSLLIFYLCLIIFLIKKLKNYHMFYYDFFIIKKGLNTTINFIYSK